MTRSSTTTPFGNTKADRIEFIDFLRGFALFGILAVNLPYFAKPMYLVGSLGENTNLLDSIASWIVAFFFESKFYLLFSFLFGYGFRIQWEHNAEENRKSRYIRRILGLGLFGILHGIFLFLGDILLTYAILGSLLWFLRDKSVSWLLRFSFFFLGVACAFKTGLGLAEGFWRERLSDSLPLLLEESRRAYLGTFWQSNLHRAKETILSFPFLVSDQWPSVISLFALGFAAAKASCFSDWAGAKAILGRIFPWALALALIGNAIYTFHSRHILPETLAWGWKIAFGISDKISAPALTLCYVYWLGNYFHSETSIGDRPWFMSPGKLSLTCYLGESLICTWIFCGWGLGKFDQVGNFVLLVMTPGIWLFLSLLARIWIRFYSLGPAEWILRKITYGN